MVNGPTNNRGLTTDNGQFSISNIIGASEILQYKKPVLQSRSNPLERRTCQFWKAGHCIKGANCQWSHSPEVSGQKPPDKKQSTPKQRRKEKEEREREAQLGAERMQREKAEAERKAKEAQAREARLEAERKARTQAEAERQARLEVERKAKQAQVAEREANVTIQQVVLRESTLVTCSAGLDVQRIVCGFDCCYVTIKNLPQNVKRNEVEELFTQQGVDRDMLCILNLRRVDGDKMEAKVIVDAEVGDAIAAGLDGIEFRDSDGLEISVNDNAGPNRMGSSERNANVLTISWFMPSLTMIATYLTPAEAKNAAMVYNNAILHGRRIRVELDQGRNRTISKEMCHSVKIMGLPLGVIPDDVRSHVDAVQVRPLGLGMNFDSGEVHTVLRQHLSQTGGFRSYNVSPANAGRGNIEVRARFDSWEEAKSAHDSLKDRRLRIGFPIFRLWLPKPIQYTITIPLQQYRAQKSRWDSIAEREDNKAASVRITNNGTDRAFIRVLGDDKKAVGQLKVRVENLVAGETLDSTFWHRSFTTGVGRQFLDRVHSQTKAFVRSDWKTQSLKLYADGNAQEAALKLIRDEIERLESLEWTVRIYQGAVGFFVRKGVATLKEELGEDAVTLELRPTCRLVVRGGEEARRAVNRLLEESRNDFQPEKKDSDQDMCPICFDEVATPVLLGCGHMYCTACIRHYLTSALERKQFPLVCVGDADKCKAPIAIPIIRRFLSPHQFDQLVEEAVTTYIESQPAKFKYCTTPDCTQVYRSEGERRALTCPSCFTTVCTACNKEAHDGMMCEERNLTNDPTEQERRNEQWATAFGAKRCPSCQVWIQKTEGCNHMTCHCGTHLCWICLGSFAVGNDVYAHLRQAHGGIYDDGIQREQEQAGFAFAQRLQREEEARVNGRRAAAVQENPLQGLGYWFEPERVEEAIILERMRREQQLRQMQEQRQREEEARRAAERRREQENRGWGCIVM
ncbi:hypothetical protein AX17_006500 [Amanita inopinata Kibby_2008]|nr:hypothetical protein AX17_006500 [Amanita inopinata Kibby_2008]